MLLGGTIILSLLGGQLVKIYVRITLILFSVFCTFTFLAPAFDKHNFGPPSQGNTLYLPLSEIYYLHGYSESQFLAHETQN